MVIVAVVSAQHDRQEDPTLLSARSCVAAPFDSASAVCSLFQRGGATPCLQRLLEEHGRIIMWREGWCAFVLLMQ